MPSSGEPEVDESRKRLLHQALDLVPEERRAFLEVHFEKGDTLNEAIELLEGVEGLGSFLEEPLTDVREGFRPSMPERIGSFRVERILGWGSMGVVYLAHQADPPRPVAVKLLRLDCTGPRSLDRFQREAEVLARLTHPGIAAIYMMGTEDLGAGEQPWFAMEYVEGDTLSAHAEVARLDRRARVRLVAQIARIVQHAHDQGVVHRDLKPDNVMVRTDGRVCVLDFGVAHTAMMEENFLTLTATGQVFGTLAYMAPEQARGGEAGPAADQYALGAILYELLAGELPLPVRGCLPHEALRIIADGHWTPPTRHNGSLAGDLEAILATALAPEVNRRYTKVGGLADDLDRWLAGQRIHARPPSRLDGVGRLLRKHPLLVGGGAAALLLIGGVLAVALNATLDRNRESRISLLFSDRALRNALVGDAGGLWPFGGTKVEEFDAWLIRAEDLASRLGRHREAANSLSDRLSTTSTAVGSEMGDDWLVAQSNGLVDLLGEFTSPDGLLQELRARRGDAERLHMSTIQEPSASWKSAAARLAADARFEALDLAPQLGLVPLGPDPDSSLEEFAVYGSGKIPVRPQGKGGMIAREGDAIVLVLIPGGSHWIGAQDKDPSLPNYVGSSPQLSSHEGPPFKVRLDPFLIGKFELTQDQWLRLKGDNPSDLEAGSRDPYGQAISLLHPVESLSWSEARERLQRVGLTLPTEAQWEVAARAGSPWAYIFGESARNMVGHVNWRLGSPQETGAGALKWADGYFAHMPVGELKPTAFGLHHVLGNVWELCLDNYKVNYHELEHRDGDGLVMAEPDGDISRRGGDWAQTPGAQSVFLRQTRLLYSGDTNSGVRPARALLPREISDSWRSPSAGPSSE